MPNSLSASVCRFNGKRHRIAQIPKFVNQMSRKSAFRHADCPKPALRDCRLPKTPKTVRRPGGKSLLERFRTRCGPLSLIRGERAQWRPFRRRGGGGAFDPKTSQPAKQPKSRGLSRRSFRFRTSRWSPPDSVKLKPSLGEGRRENPQGRQAIYECTYLSLG
jgi:hypothetical protein